MHPLMIRCGTSGHRPWFWLLGLLCAAPAPARGAPVAENVHPGYRAVSLIPRDFEPIVGGLDWWPDGRLAVLTMEIQGHDHISGPSHVFLLDHVLNGNPDAITTKKYATGFHIPTGIRVVEGKAYVLDNRDGLYRLDPVPGREDTASLTLITSKGVQGDDRKWAAGFGYNPKDGFFYLGIGVYMVSGGFSKSPQPPYRGTIVKVSKDGSIFEPVVGGLRQPNGITFDSQGQLFTSDNQGSWLPASKVLWGRPNTFYGHPDTPLDYIPVSPPTLWLPYGGELSKSPAQMLELPDGPYAGQFLMGEVTNRLLMRVGLEWVGSPDPNTAGGAWQGCVFKHSWDFPSGPNRLLSAKDGSIIVGSAGGNSGWVSGDQYWDLERLVPTGTVPFEMRMIRSKGPNTMEIEFTKPVQAAAVTPANFSLSQWDYHPTSAYGGPRMNVSTPSVEAATPSEDGRKVTLTISGLKEEFVVGFTLHNLIAASGEALWTDQGWYTLNKFGPGTDHATDSPTSFANRPQVLAEEWSVRPAAPGLLDVRAPGIGEFTFTLTDMRGRVVAHSAAGAGIDGTPVAIGPNPGMGIYFWEGRGPQGVAGGKLVLP